MRRLLIQPLLITLLTFPVLTAGQSQRDSNQKQDHQQPDQQQDDKQSGESSSSSSSSAAADELKQADTGAKYDPLPAEQDVEVGTFYMHKGDMDAAIARFEDAIKLKSNFAKPRLLLAEIFEKKGDKATAAKYYKEYLEVYPHAPDAEKIRK